MTMMGQQLVSRMMYGRLSKMEGRGGRGRGGQKTQQTNITRGAGQKQDGKDCLPEHEDEDRDGATHATGSWREYLKE